MQDGAVLTADGDREAPRLRQLAAMDRQQLRGDADRRVARGLAVGEVFAILVADRVFGGDIEEVARNVSASRR